MLRDQLDGYMIGTNRSRSVNHCVEVAFDEAGVECSERHVEIDPSLVPPSEFHQLLGVCSKTERELGWALRTSFAELIRLVVATDFELLRR